MDLDTDHPANQQNPDHAAASPAVDVVIPVFGGLKETRRCLGSVLNSLQATGHEVIVVDDASPDAAIRAYLAELRDAGRITLITNDCNIGFVDSANLGLMAHPDRDVVLLNSDTEVHGDWLDRLRACAGAHNDVATVTPFSNNATLCSYPRISQSNPLPDGETVAALDDIFRQVNDGRSVSIPTAVGFCVYFTRYGLEEVGYLDSLKYGRGYCEENDFSARAHSLGFRHLLCGDVFVFHQGGASFGAGAAALSAAAMETFNRMHPGYWPLVAKHLAEDPQRELRRRVDIARLAASGRPKLLLIGDSLSVTAHRQLLRLARLLEPDHDVLILSSVDASLLNLVWARAGEEFNAFFDAGQDYKRLVGFLRDLGVARADFHQPRGQTQLRSLPRDLDVPFDFTVHDYPPPEAEEAAGAAGNSDHRSLAELLDGAERVLVPSRPALDRYRAAFPKANVVLLPFPWAEAGSAPATAELKVMVLGDLSDENGLEQLEACAADAAARRLPLFYRVLGRPLRRLSNSPQSPLTFTGPVDETGLADQIRRERGDAVFFPGGAPRPDVATLGAAEDAGLPVVAPALDLFAERLDGRQARLFDPLMAPAGINDLLMELREAGAGMENA